MPTKFEAIYRFYPPSAFGVPDDDVTVLPEAKPGGMNRAQSTHRIFPTQDHVGWGTLSQYRPDADRFSDLFQLGGITVQFIDNYATLKFEAENLDEAGQKCRAILVPLVRRLTLLTSVPFSYRRIQLTWDGGSIGYSPPASNEFAFYNLEELRHAFDRARALMAVTDPRFEKAALYVEYGSFFAAHAFEWSAWRRYLLPQMIATVLLSYWKAISAILGDTSKGEDPRGNAVKLGFDPGYFSKVLEPIRDVRNDYDVAHYDLDEDRVRQSKQLIESVHKTASDVLLAYAKYIEQGNPPFPPPP